MQCFMFDITEEIIISCFTNQLELSSNIQVYFLINLEDSENDKSHYPNPMNSGNRL